MEITFYIGYHINNIENTGVKFTTDKIENVVFLSKNYPDYSNEEIFIKTNTGIITLKEHLRIIRDNGIKNISVLWAFLEKTRRENKKQKSVKAVYDLFKELPIEEKIILNDLYNKLDNVLSSKLWEVSDTYLENNPDFYLSEDGMMDLVPHLITMGEKRVNTFLKKPHLGLNVAQKEWSYDFDFYQAFLSFSMETLN